LHHARLLVVRLLEKKAVVLDAGRGGILRSRRRGQQETGEPQDDRMRPMPPEKRIQFQLSCGGEKVSFECRWAAGASIGFTEKDLDSAKHVIREELKAELPLVVSKLVNKLAERERRPRFKDRSGDRRQTDRRNRK
jgi:hypothetical protein